ncbi:hypothetical protein CC117_03925 [Parafrankia colletiae]|uniref:Uncharacterized protein n=1 Tax=Parafrankia colletiae TaxID=573497 RepID=A0A1S1R0L3_9ACTN|nr:hypothetical protein [Parafrankia colletiae]MCK9899379.1 hypothetical protein [Frankia sp. Cpl3]OHV38872.1 hypothetical protein CC117_03925 [Parafrankia colletiae]
MPPDPADDLPFEVRSGSGDLGPDGSGPDSSGPDSSAGPAQEPPAGGWTPPVEDPLFGPLPTYVTGAYPLAGHQQGGYPIAGHLPTGPLPGSGTHGAAGVHGAQSAGWPGDPGQAVGTGGQTSPAELGPEQTGGFSFHLRTATSPLPVLAPRPEAPAVGQASAGRPPSATTPAGPQEPPTGPIATPYPEEDAAQSRPGLPGGEPRARSTNLAKPARTRVALSRQQTDRDDADRDDADRREAVEGGENGPGSRARFGGDVRRFEVPEEERAPQQRGTRRLIAVVAAVMLTLVAAGAVIVLARGGGDGTSGTPTPTAAAPSVDPNFINSAASDSRPVAANEFFPDREITVQGHRYTRLGSSLVSGCPDRSGELVTALTDDSCTQLVRALYLTAPAGGGPQVLAGVSVFVTDAQSTAQSAATIAAQGRGGVTALPIPAGSIENARVLGPAGDNSWRAAIARGHYMILTQLAYVDGSQGGPDDPALRNTITDLGLIAVEPIAQRMVAGGTGTAGGGPSPATSPAGR